MSPKLSKATTVAAIFILSIFMATQALGVSLATAAQDRVTCRVEADRSVLPADVSQNLILKITLDAPKVPENTARPRVNIALVDGSIRFHGRHKNSNGQGGGHGGPVPAWQQ